MPPRARSRAVRWRSSAVAADGRRQQGERACRTRRRRWRGNDARERRGEVVVVDDAVDGDGDEHAGSYRDAGALDARNTVDVVGLPPRARFRAAVSGTSSVIAKACVPSCGEYANTPTRSNCTSSRKSSSDSKSASVSPGKPTMHVVRMATSGMIARMRATRSRIVARRSGRRIRFSTSSDACWIGMSRYGTMRASLAMSSRSRGVSPAE